MCTTVSCFNRKGTDWMKKMSFLVVLTFIFGTQRRRQRQKKQSQKLKRISHQCEWNQAIGSFCRRWKAIVVFDGDGAGLIEPIDSDGQKKELLTRQWTFASANRNSTNLNFKRKKKSSSGKQKCRHRFPWICLIYLHFIHFLSVCAHFTLSDSLWLHSVVPNAVWQVRLHHNSSKYNNGARKSASEVYKFHCTRCSGWTTTQNKRTTVKRVHAVDCDIFDVLLEVKSTLFPACWLYFDMNFIFYFTCASFSFIVLLFFANAFSLKTLAVLCFFLYQ